MTLSDVLMKMKEQKKYLVSLLKFCKEEKEVTLSLLLFVIAWMLSQNTKKGIFVCLLVCFVLLY